MTEMDLSAVNLEAIIAAEQQLVGHVIRTPSVDVRQTGLESLLPDGSKISMKLELMQKAGSFKARGSYLSIKALSSNQRAGGVVAASGGNHALAVAWAARTIGVSVKIAIPKIADPVRIEGCRNLGAELVLCEDIHEAFDTMHMIEATEGRAMIHPFEGLNMSLGAATCGKELFEANPDVEVVILPVGGGGLISGMSAAIKFLNPDVEVYGVEPFGADSMYQSFKAGSPQSITKVDTIADSLGSPTALPLSFALTRTYVDDIVRVSDDAIRDAMRAMNASMKLVPEPACAASLAGALGPLREKCEGKRVGLLACGANISLDRFAALIA